MDYKNENNLTDKYLIGKVLGGNTAAFSTIIKNTERLVAQIVFKMIPNNEDRKDIVQDIYLKTFQKLGSFKFQSKLSTWIGEIEKLQPIYKVLINLYHNEELSYTEISQITQLPEGTVKNYLFRARKKLKENLLLLHKKEEL